MAVCPKKKDKIGYFGEARIPSALTTIRIAIPYPTVISIAGNPANISVSESTLTAGLPGID